MKRTLIIAGLLVLILTVSVAGTLTPAIIANAQEDDQTDESRDDERGQEDDSSDSEDDGASDDEEDDDRGASADRRNDQSTDSERDREHDRDQSESKTKIAVEDDGLEIELKIQGLDLEDGTYSALLSCTNPAVNLNLEDAFKVEGGKGELESDIELDAGTYSDCKLQLEQTDMTLNIGSFTIVGEEDDQDRERREDRDREIVENHDAREIHDRHTSAQPASPGEYEPGARYMLSATGLADNSTSTANASVNATLGVWKSVRSLVLFDVLGGNVTIGDKAYTIQIGYAIYSDNGDVLRMRALATDDATGDIVKLSLRGNADETAELPKDSGENIALAFEGNSGMFRNEVNGWELTMEGYVEAA